MSFASSSNSALYDQPSYPVGAVGSIIVPSLNTAQVASAANLNVLSSSTLTVPYGRWVITGAISLDASAGGQTLNGYTVISRDGVSVYQVENVAQTDSTTVPLSYSFSSDGTNVLAVTANYATSGGSTYGLKGNNINSIQLMRVG